MVVVKTKPIFEEDLLALGEDVNAEVVDGELIIMSPTKVDHGEYAVAISTLIKIFLGSRKIGRVLGDQVTYITQENPDGSIRGSPVPDVSYISHQRMPADSPRNVLSRIAPEIAIEIISPSESKRNIFSKVREYLDFGVQQVWLVFHTDQQIQVCTPDNPLGKTYGINDTLPGGDALPGFSVPVKAILDLEDTDFYHQTTQALMNPPSE